MLINIEPPARNIPKFALFSLGFRPFFLGAAAFSILAMTVWLGVYLLGWNLGLAGLPATTWHAHEMIYGYSLAVIAGFLLTAVKNWTGIQTLQGYQLAGLFTLWAVTRILALTQTPIEIIAVLDCLFLLVLIVALTYPIIKANSRKQLGIIAKLILILLSNILFYLGNAGVIENGVQQGLLSGLYLVIGLILMLGRRVIPFFIEKGVDDPAQIKNWQWLDVSSLVLFFIFWITASFTALDTITALLATTLFVLHSIRLWGWYTVGIWKKPLLWILYIAYIFLIFGFLLTALALFLDLTASITIHAFAMGGIGMMTMGMMARVSLGHTGRNIAEPPKLLVPSLLLLLTGSIVRVIFPLLFSDHYTIWIGISQVLWISSFALFFLIYLPVLVMRRVDGRLG